ncbi:MAG: ATP-binding protein [Paracoccaceae bacterium]|nr:ATP-binding protein [Paracoccaceae bacterium]
MIRRSLKLRILALAALSTGGALLFLWFLLTQLFEQQIAARFYSELGPHLEQLARAAEPAPDGGVELVGEMSDQRFQRPFSGLYWQVKLTDGAPLTSESLWDEALDLPGAGAPAGEIARHDRVAFQDTALMVLERTVVLGGDVADIPLRMAVAIDRTELERAKGEFGDRVLMLVALLGAFLMAAAAVQIGFGLKPLAHLKARLNAVRAGEAQRLDGNFPAEIEELVGEVNGLLAGREEMVARARARASDLAHGLKTPLAVLAAESRRLATQGETAAADEISAQIERMSRNVERELVRTRTRGAGGRLASRTALEPAIERLLGAFARLPGGDQINWHNTVSPGAAIAMDQADFEEVAGNLLDNARKWARSAVRVTATATADDGAATLVIEDDGPGVPPEDLAEVVERGRRLDQATPGSGLGLAIARDILELYDGRLTLEAAAPSGLRVVVTVPDPATPGRPA